MKRWRQIQTEVRQLQQRLEVLREQWEALQSFCSHEHYSERLVSISENGLHFVAIECDECGQRKTGGT